MTESEQVNALYEEWKAFHIKSLSTENIDIYNRAKDGQLTACKEACRVTGRVRNSENVLHFMDNFYERLKSERKAAKRSHG